MRLVNKVISGTLAVAMAASLVACGSSSAPAASAAPVPEASAPAASADAPAPAYTGLSDAAKAKAANGEMMTAEELGVTVTSTDKVDIVWAHNASNKAATHLMYDYMVDLINENTNGNIHIEIYPESQLGNATEINQNLKEGTIQMGCGNLGGLLDDSMAYFDLNGAVTNMEDALLLTEPGTPVRELTEQRMHDLKFELVGLTPYGFRVTSSNKALNTFDDLKGLNIRTTENNAQLAFWKACGANPTPLAFSDLYISLQQGLVDAQENPYNTIITNKFYEVQKYVTPTNHQMFFAGFWMNKEFYDSLPQDYQELISAAGDAAATYGYNVGMNDGEESKQKLIEGGTTICEWTDEDYAKLQEAGRSMWPICRDLCGDEAVDLVLESLGIEA